MPGTGEKVAAAEICGAASVPRASEIGTIETRPSSASTAEFVAQEEMARFTGYWWSPDSQSIVYEESDAKGVEIWYVADPIRPDGEPLPSFYPRPGKANVKVRLGVIPIKGGATTWIDWNTQLYPYMTWVRWTKDSPLLVGVQTRDQTELVVLQADPKTGQTTKLLLRLPPGLEPGAPRPAPFAISSPAARDGAGSLFRRCRT